MMRKTVPLFVGLCAAFLVLAGFAFAQQTTPLLGEYARKQREQKAAKAAQGKSKTYTNDDLPKTGGLSTSESKPAAGAAKEGEAAKPGDATKPGEAAKPGEAPKPSPAEEEKAWRDRFKKLRDDLATEEKKLDLYQRELNMANVQFYSNPDQALREQTMRSEINSKTADVEKQKAAVEAARKALADSEEELHRKGLPPGWAR